MLGYVDLDRALEIRPRHVTHVTETVFEGLERAHASGDLTREFELAWHNGAAFAASDQGLRGRPPWSVEWKGPHKPASKNIETIPADLRIDHVYLISCKYRSTILHNSAPAAIFNEHLARLESSRRMNWYSEVSPTTFEQVWRPVYKAAGLGDETDPRSLNKNDRKLISAHLAAAPVDIDEPEYRAFIEDVSRESAARWMKGLRDQRAIHEMYWRILRMQAAPYFVLGARNDWSPLRYRVGTPWDFRQEFRVVHFSATPGVRRQPSVDWHFNVETSDGANIDVEGYVEVRWSHGKLTAPPEAKVHLKTDPLDVPGYTPL